jgi:hypothetical protein
VLHYLGPHRLEAAGLLAAFRSSCDIDVFFEPAGRDVADEPEHDHGHGCGHCGAEGGGGCGTGGGCADCGVKRLLAAQRR